MFLFSFVELKFTLFSQKLTLKHFTINNLVNLFCFFNENFINFFQICLFSTNLMEMDNSTIYK